MYVKFFTYWSHGQASRWKGALTFILLGSLLMASLSVHAQDIRWRGNGALSIVNFDYNPPAGAYYVDGTNGSDVSTRDGKSLTNAWKTIQYAVNRAVAGSVIVIKGGTYRLMEPVTITKKLTLQPYHYDDVWLKGSEHVDGWQETTTGSGLWYKAWNTAQDSRLVSADCDLCVGTSQEALASAKNFRDMLFFNGTGKAFGQVTSLSQLNDTTFYVDRGANRIYLKRSTDPDAATVEVSGRSIPNDNGGYYHTSAFYIKAAETQIRGLGIVHFADKVAVYIQANKVLIENCTIGWNAFNGFGTGGADIDGVTLRGNQVHYQGNTGIRLGSGVTNLTIEDNDLNYNNEQTYNIGWDAAAIKLTQTRTVTIRNNTFHKNNATSIWMDRWVDNAKIYKNLCRNSRGPGIYYEVSGWGIVAANTIVGGSIGVGVSGSRNVWVLNNTLVNNPKPIFIKDNSRYGPTDKHDPAYGEYAASRADNPIDFDTYNVFIRNNIITNKQGTGSTEVAEFVDKDDKTITIKAKDENGDLIPIVGQITFQWDECDYTRQGTVVSGRGNMSKNIRNNGLYREIVGGVGSPQKAVIWVPGNWDMPNPPTNYRPVPCFVPNRYSFDTFGAFEAYTDNLTPPVDDPDKPDMRTWAGSNVIRDITSSTNPFLVSDSDFRLKSGSPAIGAADEGLPTDIGDYYNTNLKDFYKNELKWDLAAIDLSMGANQAVASARMSAEAKAELAGEATLYPNPSSSLVHLRVNGSQPLRVVVRNSLSREVMRLEKTLPVAGEALPMRVSHLPQGIYLVTIEQDGQRTTQKLLISR